MAAGPIEDGWGTEFFEIRDVENNVIEICKEPRPISEPQGPKSKTVPEHDN